MPEILDRRISFNAGEISPWLDPRLDMDKYRMGCRQCQNMRPTIYGGVLRRAGTVYIGAAATDTGNVRLVPYTVSTDTNFVLEFTNLKIRIWDASTKALVVDATPATIELVTPYTAAQLNQLQFAQQNDTLYITHPEHFPRLVRRFSATSWGISQIVIDWPATLGPNASNTLVWPLTNIYTTTTPVAWSAGTYASGDIRSYGGAYYISAVAGNTTTPGTDAAAGQWLEGTWINAVAPSTPTAYSSATYYTAGQLITYSSKTYVRTRYSSGTIKGWSPADDGMTVSGDVQLWDLTTTNGVLADALAMRIKGETLTLKSSASLWASTHVGTQWIIGHSREDLKMTMFPEAVAAGSVTEALYCLGEWTATFSIPTLPSSVFTANVIIETSMDMVTWETRQAMQSTRAASQVIMTGTEETPVFLRLRLVSKSGTVPTNLQTELEVGNPNQYGIVEITAFTSATEVTATVRSPIYRAVPTLRWEEPAWTAGNGYPRAVTLHQNRLFFGGNTRKPTTIWGSAVDSYGDFRLAAADDRAVSYTLMSDESSRVEWLVSQDMLVIGTTSSEWVFGTQAGEDTPKLKRNTVFGSAEIQARAINDSVVYVQRSKRKVREYAWSIQRDGYASNDLTMLAEHLGDASFQQIAIQRNPEALVHVVTTRGDMMTLTYERGQGVAGWSRHVTDGLFQSVAVVYGTGTEDHVWVAVRRTIGGTAKNFIERFQPDVMAALKAGTVEDYVFTDCSLKRTGSATTTITGLTYLEGKTVSVIGDGKPQADRVVTGGAITITSASTVCVGLPYVSTFEPTYLETPDPQSMSALAKKRLHRAVVNFWKSSGMEVSADDGTTWQPVAPPVTPTFDGAIGTLFTGAHEQFLEGSSARQTSLVLRQIKPMPLAVMGMAMRYNLEAS